MHKPSPDESAPLPTIPSTRPSTRAYRLALARPPAPEELAEDLAFVKSQAEAYKATGHADPEASALADFCQALMGLNEFVYVE